MKSWACIGVALIAAGCASQRTPVVGRPYLVPIDAAKAAMLDWSEKEVNACFGSAKDSDTVGGWPRYFHERGACKFQFMFRDGNVHSVEGYGNVQECWWLMDACERGVEFRPATRGVWEPWTMGEVTACFGEMEEIEAPWKEHPMQASRDGCRMNLDIEEQQRLNIYYWSEGEKGDCKRLLRKCEDIREDMED